LAVFVFGEGEEGGSPGSHRSLLDQEFWLIMAMENDNNVAGGIRSKKEEKEKKKKEKRLISPKV